MIPNWRREKTGAGIGPLLADPGVGGLTVALTTRLTIENIIGSFMIFANKPYRDCQRVKVMGRMVPRHYEFARGTRNRYSEYSFYTICELWYISFRYRLPWLPVRLDISGRTRNIGHGLIADDIINTLRKAGLTSGRTIHSRHRSRLSCLYKNNLLTSIVSDYCGRRCDTRFSLNGSCQVNFLEGIEIFNWEQLADYR